MALIAYIDGWPLYSSYQEALIDAKARGCVGGYHSHNLQGVTGYMPCHKHSTLVDISAPLTEEPGGGGPPETYQYPQQQITTTIGPGPGTVVAIGPTTITPTTITPTTITPTIGEPRPGPGVPPRPVVLPATTTPPPPAGLLTDIDALEVERERRREFIATLREEQGLEAEMADTAEEEKERLELIRKMQMEIQTFQPEDEGGGDTVLDDYK